jgi:pyruvate carboxylase subunit B
MSSSGKKYAVSIDDRTFMADVVSGEDGLARVQLDGGEEAFEVQLFGTGQRPVAIVNGRVVELFRELDGSLRAAGTRAAVRVDPAAARRSQRVAQTEAGPLNLRSPMPGRVVKLLAAPGDTVAAGMPLVVIEAMKMENELLAPRAGKVARVLVAAGDAVERDALLVEIG